jgi:hypothetical protein
LLIEEANYYRFSLSKEAKNNDAWITHTPLVNSYIGADTWGKDGNKAPEKK